MHVPCPVLPFPSYRPAGRAGAIHDRIQAMHARVDRLSHIVSALESRYVSRLSTPPPGCLRIVSRKHSALFS